MRHRTIYAIVSAVILAFIAFANNRKNQRDGKVFLPKPLLLFGVTLTSLCILLGGYFVLFKDPEATHISVYYGLLLFAISGFLIIIAYINVRKSYDDECITAVNFFGIVKEYKFTELTAIRENNGETLLYFGKRWIMIDKIDVGGNTLIYFAKNKYRELHGEELPRK